MTRSCIQFIGVTKYLILFARITHVSKGSTTHKQQVQIIPHILDHLIEEGVSQNGIVWRRIERLRQSTADEATAALRGARDLKVCVFGVLIRSNDSKIVKGSPPQILCSAVVEAAFEVD